MIGELKCRKDDSILRVKKLATSIYNDLELDIICYVIILNLTVLHKFATFHTK